MDSVARSPRTPKLRRGRSSCKHGGIKCYIGGEELHIGEEGGGDLNCLINTELGGIEVIQLRNTFCVELAKLCRVL